MCAQPHLTPVRPRKNILIRTFFSTIIFLPAVNTLTASKTYHPAFAWVCLHTHTHNATCTYIGKTCYCQIMLIDDLAITVGRHLRAPRVRYVLRWHRTSSWHRESVQQSTDPISDRASYERFGVATSTWNRWSLMNAEQRCLPQHRFVRKRYVSRV